MTKRFLDLLLAIVGLLLTSPVFLLIAILIKRGDRGPIFYCQVRVGRHNKLFHIFKFRTMIRGADRAGPAITAAGDSRITPVGRWLRKTKLDELPQLWNVLRGEMSFVGPRPEVPKYVALYSPEQRHVLILKPGITDEASLTFRNEEELLAAAPDREKFYIETCMPAKLELNLSYARQATLWRDINVIIKTFLVIWLRR